MVFLNIQKHCSITRTQRYLLATSNNPKRARRLYIDNLKVAQQYHPLLGLVEVILRNKLDEVLRNYLHDNDWLITQSAAGGFMNDPSLSNKKLFDQINKTNVRLKRAGIAVSQGRLIAEQTFGFWTEYFELEYYKLLRGRPIKIFKQLPPSHGRKEVATELQKIRQFRNRINHNEPICFSGINIDFKDTLAIYYSICNLLEWIDPDLKKLLKEFNNVPRIIQWSIIRQKKFWIFN